MELFPRPDGSLKVRVLQSTDMGNFNGKIDGDASGGEFKGDKQHVAS